MCEKVWMPVDGEYFCDKACVVTYNKSKVQEHERWLETLDEEEDRAQVAPPAVIEVRRRAGGPVRRGVKSADVWW